jgi:hypothetical protein
MPVLVTVFVIFKGFSPILGMNRSSSNGNIARTSCLPSMHRQAFCSPVGFLN